MPPSDLPISLLRRMYRTMVLIRRFEEAVADRVTAGEIKTPCTSISVRKPSLPASGPHSTARIT